ncbi:2-isopropylmalate synthase, partial [Paraburkholderia sp. SIMBA_030]
LKTEHSLDLPRRAQIEFSGVIQRRTDTVGGEVSGEQLWQIFQDEYLPSSGGDGQWGRYSLGNVKTETDDDGGTTLHASLTVDG